MPQVLIVSVDPENTALYLDGSFIVATDPDAIEFMASNLSTLYDTQVERIKVNEYKYWQWHEIGEQLRTKGILQPRFSTTGELTVNQQKEYLQNKGVRCPHCNSDILEGCPVDVDGGTATQQVACVDCNKNWIDLYTLTEIKA